MLLPKGHKIAIEWEHLDTADTFDSVGEAENEMARQYGSSTVHRVYEIDENGEKVQDLGCNWSVEIEPL